MKLNEVKLSKPVQKYFESLGYKVYFEIPEFQKVVDIIALKDSQVVAVELKVGYCKQALRQAQLNNLFADRSYIAVKSKPRADSVLKCQKWNVGILLVRNEITVLLEVAESDRRPLANYKESAIESCERNKGNTIAGLPCQKGIGLAVEANKGIEEYVRLNPKASWKEIYANVPNHYASAASMRQSIEKFNHREYLKEKYKDRKCKECYRLSSRYGCHRSRNRKPTSKACIDFIETD